MLAALPFGISGMDRSELRCFRKVRAGKQKIPKNGSQKEHTVNRVGLIGERLTQSSQCTTDEKRRSDIHGMYIDRF